MATNQYQGNDIMRMQQDAVRRVREMQRRAKEKLNQTPPVSSGTPYPQVSREQAAPPANTQKENASILDKLGLDREKALLLLLIILLLNEGADQKLILALCYLLI
ncbi:MAG: hypothetical protein ACOX60_09115 [Massiliimalia sp.]|jgi:hypothetical protein